MSLAFDDDTLNPTPTWTRLDAGVTRVAAYTIDRGRATILETTGGGTATVTINDVDGTLDPTNAGGDYYGKLDPLIQAAIARWNPVAEEWDTRFRGFVADYDYVFDPSQRLNVLTLSLVDIYEILNAIQMQPGAFGDTPPAASAGQVFFDNAPISGMSGGRFDQVMTNAGIPTEFYVSFSGNVQLFESVYSPGETALTPLQEMCDAEWKNVANLYTDRLGRIVFHGRYAEFDPAAVISGLSDPTVWDFHEWKAGDGAAVAASSSDTAHVREFSFNRGLDRIINSAIATPLYIADADVAGQLVTDGTSIGKYGIRSWQAQNLLTKEDLVDSAGPNVATKRVAQSMVDNFKAPKNRITHIAFRPMRPSALGAAANWLMLSKVDISDTMTVTVGSPGGGGFSAVAHSVQGVHEQVDGRIRDGVAHGAEGYDNVTLTLDLEERVFDASAFPT